MKMLTAAAIHYRINAVPLLSDVSLAVAAGEILAIIGPNGAGKTSLIKALTGAVQPDSGSVCLNGQPLASYPTLNLARTVAVLPQQSLLEFPFTATEVVQLGRTPHATGAQADAAIVQAALASMDSSHLSRRLYTQLSGGEKQRVQLARVLAQIWPEAGARPKLLVLDEPTTALDVAHQQLLMQTLQALAAQGITVVLTVHDFNLAARYADTLLALSGGRVAACGPPAQVLTQSLMQQLFAVHTRIIHHPQSGRPVVLFDD